MVNVPARYREPVPGKDVTNRHLSSKDQKSHFALGFERQAPLMRTAGVEDAVRTGLDAVTK